MGSGRSYVAQLLETLDKWPCDIEDSKPVDSLYLDFSKAFNSVPHQQLLLKLQACGIEGQLLEWLKAFLMDRRQRMTVDGTK